MSLRVLCLATVFLLAACAPASPPDAVVDVTGMGEIRFGLKRTDLATHLDTGKPGCNTQLREYPQGSAVFTGDGTLVLLWFRAPLATAERITTGTPVGTVKAAYPQATEVHAPRGGNGFDGLLVTPGEGEHGYLFLHDGVTVRKAIAGYVIYLHRLFDSGFGVC